jgi:hypothetical protein
VTISFWLYKILAVFQGTVLKRVWKMRRGNRMNLKAKIYVENQKKDGETQLAARLALLHGKGMSPDAIQKDATLRQIKALIRKAETRLAAIRAQEKLNQERAQAKLAKLAAKQAAREMPAAEAAEEAPAKKAKKGKKPPAPKEGKPEKKKEKKEKKAEPEKKE